jgi:hypothetical protein
MHWLDKEMVGKPRSFIEDEVACRVHDYEWALKKHGIQTVLGNLSSVLEPKALAASAAAVAGLSVAGHSLLGALAGVTLLAGRVAVNIARVALDYEDTRRTSHPEILFVFELRKLAKRSARRDGR